MIIRVLITLVIVVTAPGYGLAEDWISYGGDVGGTRYSTLDQINRDNVS